jgi:hypothetical protein
MTGDSAVAVLARAQFSDAHPGTQGVEAVLSRVDVDVGFLAQIHDRRCDVVSTARVRYNLPADLLAQLAHEMQRDGQLRVYGRELRAEVDVAPLRELYEDA